MTAHVVPFPPHVPTDRERWRIEQQVREEGLVCGVEDCGREASDDQIETWLTGELWGEAQPSAWACPDQVHWCGLCKGEGRMPGLAGEPCSNCRGTGEWDENDNEPWHDPKDAA